ncbi:YtxH domain-containing protein [Salinibacterium sp. SWN167]|nr:YtxH domain-containing protein [Salinibacterium sp. SWN139]MBH0081979.1 YtxH domain-containing protein [Salinibacterium sp. SWN167]
MLEEPTGNEMEFTMKGKILLVVGLGIGYVLGTRAGREKYEKIKATAGKLWNDPRITQQRHNAEDFVKDKAPDVAEFLADGAKKVVKQVASSKSDKAAPEKVTTTSSAPKKKPAAKKSSSAASTTKSTNSK